MAVGEKDAVAHGACAVRLGADFRWPGGQKVAVVFNVAFEAWSDGKAPGIGPMGNPLPQGIFDTNALMWGHYGVVRGIERLLRVLDRAKTRASVMVSGVLAERAPDRVRAIADAGHEIVAHGYAQEIVPAKLTHEEDRANIATTTKLLSTAVGAKPKGWISPRGTPGAGTARLLVEAGYHWQGDVFDDDRPYVQIFDTGRIVAIPLVMEVNDLPHAMRFGRSPRQFVELFDDFLKHALTESDAVMIDVTAHAHCYGRPSGAWAYETIARGASGRDDIWVATRAQVATHVAAAIP
ncbi:MAG: polysaccharide deacetylase family protein [Rhizobiales bacterium]|nr:polysaccharide deacetylase family protein [Hyphomicrobiales bacterium]